LNEPLNGKSGKLKRLGFRYMIKEQILHQMFNQWLNYKKKILNHPMRVIPRLPGK
jgi:hypothetical protein